MRKHRVLLKTWPLLLIIWTMDGLMASLQMHMQGVPYLNALKLSMLLSLPTILCAYFLSAILLPIFMRKRQMARFSIIALLICLIVSATHIYLSLPYLCNALSNALANPSLCSFQSLSPGYFISVVMECGTICGFRFYQEYTKTLIDHEELTTTHLQAELTLLRHQVNPHFVFNMMNSIHVLIGKNTQQAADMVLEFSDMLRYQLYDCSKPFITLEQEINYLQNYISVEYKRRGSELTVDCDWGTHLPLCYISPLILPPFVENAFKHVSRFHDQPNFIHIQLRLKTDSIFFSVQNSKDQIIPVQGDIPPHKGIGLANVQKRLAILYPGKHQLEIKETDTTYTIALEVNTNTA